MWMMIAIHKVAKYEKAVLKYVPPLSHVFLSDRFIYDVVLYSARL